MVGVLPIIAAVTAVSVQTSKITNNLPAHAVARQTTGFDPSALPQACQSPCQVINTMTGCADTTCLCTTSVGSNLESCMDCLVSSVPSVQPDAQSALDSFNEACAGTTGFSSLTLSASGSATPSAGSTTSESVSAAGPTTSNPASVSGSSAPTTAAGATTPTGSASPQAGGAMSLKVGFTLAGAMVTAIIGGLFVL
ncbi:hypothetical protein SERLA73DRAFT_184315 [Serpula lacrymans var. lacrymans S7.3]|uniref:Uncharacterized protein n=1 Tax=Serpula lacrymans var. lacrymans (strain S7.3) TaxID=936435 RepID=F8Q301_SERL3|nr:hypothetical protein SERLA73DRAFT_184315 [Serpula lacrymans var. lacrymans S7.3]